MCKERGYYLYDPASVITVCVVIAGSAVGFTAGPDPDLVGWWRLDEGSGTMAYDSSGYGNHGTIYGLPVWVEGRIGGALQFNGTDCYINCGNASSLQIQNQITMACWLKTPGFLRDWSAIVTKGDTSWRLSRSAQTGNSIHMGINGTSTAGFPWFDASKPVTDNEWHHIAGVYDGTEARIYIDGVVNARYAASGQLATNSNNVWVGGNEGAGGRLFNGLLDDVRIYRRGLASDEIQIVMLGYAGPIASEPKPKHKATDVARDVILTWAAGQYAQTHDVYLGTSEADVNVAQRANPMGVLVSKGQIQTSYTPPGPLAFDQLYYWRVDEVNGAPDYTIYRGQVWSFRTEPYAYPVTAVKATASSISTAVSGPEKTVDGSGLDANDGHGTASSTMWLSKSGQWPAWIRFEFDRVYKLHQMWVWNQNQTMEPYMGYGAKDVVVEYSLDEANWTVLEGVPVFARGTGKAGYLYNTIVDMQGVLARYVRLTVNSSWGGMKQAGLSEVRFFYVPLQAFRPEPADGASDVPLDVVLIWRSGRQAASHRLYLAREAQQVQAGLVQGRDLIQNRYPTDQDDLEYGRRYYWRVDEVNQTMIWPGDTWCFTTIGYGVVDDFESYNDWCNRVFFAWTDGFGHSGSTECSVLPFAGNGTGSTVGHLSAPFAEQLIVRSGRQSMPFGFDNTRSPYYSEIVREFDQPQAWSHGGADTLTIYLQGLPAAFIETSPGNFIMNGAGANIGGFLDQFRFAYRTLRGDGSITARIDGVGYTNAAAKAAVMIRQELDAGAGYAMVVVTPNSGIGLEWRSAANQTAQALTQPGITAPYWVRLTRKGNNFTAQRSADGLNWTTMTDDPAASTVSIEMPAEVYIGLAVTSRVVDRACGARFSNVTIAGQAGGIWQIAEIGGIAQLDGNKPEEFYVGLADASGKAVFVSHIDRAIIATGLWERWDIPFSGLSSIDINRVKRLIIGVGNPITPVPGGKGTIYIDDIRLSRIGP